jgi:hypothetical protein
VAQFFLEWEMFETKVVEKIKTHILCPILFFRKSCRLWDNVEKCGTARQATDDNILVTWRMCIPCCITKARVTLSEYVTLIAFQRPQWLLKHASVGIAILLLAGRLRIRDSMSGRGKKFFCIPQRRDRPWTPPSLLTNGYQGLYLVGVIKRLRRETDCFFI